MSCKSNGRHQNHRNAKHDQHETGNVTELTWWQAILFFRASGAANARNKSNRSTKNPNAITAMEVRTYGRNVRSLAEWSLKFLTI
jgi:hypothetical protein